jgi:filamin
VLIKFVPVEMVLYVVKLIQQVRTKKLFHHFKFIHLDEFNIYTREAGAGGLAIAIEGPAKAEIDFYDRKDGSCGVSFVCPEPGEYQVSIKFNDQHIPESPFNVVIGSPFGDAKKLTVHGLHGTGHEVNRPYMFTVNVSGARGRLDAKVTAPSGAEDACIIQEMGDGKKKDEEIL